MTTREMIVSREWQELTDGSQTVFVQINGVADVCSSAQKPDAAHPAHNMNNEKFTATPPDRLWVRASGYDGRVRVIVT